VNNNIVFYKNKFGKNFFTTKKNWKILFWKKQKLEIFVSLFSRGGQLSGGEIIKQTRVYLVILLPKMAPFSKTLRLGVHKNKVTHGTNSFV
jgi:hypothetical protein